MSPQEDPRPLFTGDIHLVGESDFVRKFNNLSDLWQEWQRVEATDALEEVKLGKFNDWFDAKFALESGF